MILFCDTSALIKLYIREEFTELVLAAAEAAAAIAVCRIAWAEAMAAFIPPNNSENLQDHQLLGPGQPFFPLIVPNLSRRH